MKPSISIIIPALNEKGNLEPTVETVVRSIEKKFNDYELLIFNDGSTDETGDIADQLARENNHIRVIHHTHNNGLGFSYREGVELATKEYIGWVPGKNSIPEETLDNMFGAVGIADIVAVYILTETRSKFRQVVSRIFTKMMNTLFGMNLRYFNGPCIHKSKLVKNVKMSTNGFAFMAETLVRLIKSGHSYVEVGLHNRDRTIGNSKAFVYKNFIRVGEVVIRLFWEVQIVGAFKGEYKYRPQVVQIDQQLS